MISFLKKWLGKSKLKSNVFEIFCGGNSCALNILILTEHINATYFISFDIPLRELHKEGKVNFAVASQKFIASSPRWSEGVDDFGFDVIIMTRYGEIHGRDILASFRQRGIAVVYHIDDDLLEIPESLGAEIRKRQGADDVVETRRYLLQNCDLIYASTRTLAELMQRRFPRQEVVYGIYAPYMGSILSSTEVNDGSRPIIGYMGSKGHQHDLELVVPTLERLLTERPNLEFEVFGTIRMPAALERFGPRVRSYSVQKSYTEFLATLASLGWAVGLAPLQDELFNHCKAPTKFIEYTACGIAVVASRVPVYEEAIPPNGGLLVERDWYSAITNLLDHPQQRQDAVAIARRHCALKYAPEVLQQQLISIVNFAIKRKINDPH